MRRQKTAVLTYNGCPWAVVEHCILHVETCAWLSSRNFCSHTAGHHFVCKTDFCRVLDAFRNVYISQTISAYILSSSHIDRNTTTPVLCSLRWLPVSYRIRYKILLLTFKSLNEVAPSYRTDFLKPYQLARQLRSTLLTSSPCLQHAAPLFATRFCRTLRQSYGIICQLLRGSACSSPEAFKTHLKTVLSARAY